MIPFATIPFPRHAQGCLSRDLAFTDCEHSWQNNLCHHVELETCRFSGAVWNNENKIINYGCVHFFPDESEWVGHHRREKEMTKTGARERWRLHALWRQLVTSRKGNVSSYCPPRILRRSVINASCNPVLPRPDIGGSDTRWFVYILRRLLCDVIGL